ncbi:MAG: hypothetical protein IKP68_04205 [Clostridia bacterium]|nr:hypothetical protein [Clostridia bacterium]
MKRILCIVFAALMCVALVSCGADPTETTNAGQAEVSTVDVDLTKLSSTMVYAEVYNMMVSPDDYIGKSVRMKGAFAYGEGDGRYYFACIISDATACCSQGIEFVLKDGRKFPSEYPQAGTEITVVGVFDTYYEGTYRYCQLIDAVME